MTAVLRNRCLLNDKKRRDRMTAQNKNVQQLNDELQMRNYESVTLGLFLLLSI